jgi:hypothetical protein
VPAFPSLFYLLRRITEFSRRLRVGACAMRFLSHTKVAAGRVHPAGEKRAKTLQTNREIFFQFL